MNTRWTDEEICKLGRLWDSADRLRSAAQLLQQDLQRLVTNIEQLEEIRDDETETQTAT